jgi:hypothetical protein
VLGSSGWRSEFGAIAAIELDPASPELSEALAERYGVPLLDALDERNALDLKPAVGL